MARHRYGIYDDELHPEKRPPKKKVTTKENTAAVKYYMYIITKSPDVEYYIGKKYVANNANGIKICRTAFETMLWLEHAIKNFSGRDANFFYLIYQVKPLEPLKEHQYTNGLTGYNVGSLEIVDSCTIEDMTKQIGEEIKNKIIPAHNQHTDLEIATVVYNNISAHKPHMDNGMHR